MTDLSQVTAVILAGGLGTHLQGVVSDRPKVMAEINGKPFITYLLDQLVATGFGRVIISTGYMANIVEDTIGARYKHLHVDYSQEETPLGTAGALKLARQTIDTEYCLVMNGDSFVEFVPVALFLFHRSKGAEITILVKSVSDTNRYGTIEMNAENEIVQFREKGSAGGSGLMNAGVYLIETGVLETIPEISPFSFEYDFFPCFTGKGLYGWETDGRFIDIGTPASSATAEMFFGCKPVTE